MTNVIESWLSWSLCESLLFLLFWVLYRCLVRFRVSPSDRYLYLKLVFVLVPVIPFLASWFSHVEFTGQLAPFIDAKGVAAGSISAFPVRVGQESFGKIFAWFASGLFMLYLVVTLVRLYRVLVSFIRLNSICEDAEPLGPSDCRWPVLIHQLKIPPATIGLLHPRILIPQQVYDSVSAEQLEMILKHESVHIERRDYLFNAVRAVVQATLIFSPFTFLLGRGFEADMEISCDDILRSRKAVVPRQYGELLVQLVKNLSPKPELASGGIFVSNSLITGRISAMKNTSMKSKPALMFASFIAFAVVFGSAVSALGLDVAANQIVNSNSTDGKDLRFKLWAKVESEAGKKSSKKEMKSQMDLNYEETGTLVLDSVEVRLTPRKKDGNQEMALQIRDQRQQQVIYESVAPMVDGSEVDFNASLAPSEGVYFRFHIVLSRLGVASVTDNPLQHKITIQTKNMPADFLLKKLSEANKFNLLLDDDFPGSEKITLDARNFPLSRVFDVVAEGTHTRWTADNSQGVWVIKFDRE